MVRKMIPMFIGYYKFKIPYNINLNGMLNKMNRLAYQNTKKDTFNPLNPIKSQNKNSNTRTV